MNLPCAVVYIRAVVIIQDKIYSSKCTLLQKIASRKETSASAAPPSYLSHQIKSNTNMPKKSTRKGLCQKKGQKKGGRKKEPEEQKSDCAEPKINNSTTDESGKKAGDMRLCPSKDFIIDVASQSTSISTLTTSDKSSNLIGEIKSVSAAKTMVNSLEMLPSSDQQSEAFEIAMRNPIFCNFVKRYNNHPSVTHSVMPEPIQTTEITHDTQPVTHATNSHSERMRKCRNKESAVDSIVSSINSLSTQEEKMQL